MTTETIAIASDHAAFDLKAQLKDELTALGYTPLDLGAHTRDSVDYPDMANALAEAIKSGKAKRGLLMCGSGVGVSIAANRHPGVRAALCHDVTTARLSRQHNNANVLVMGARLIGPDLAKECLKTFLSTDFEGGRHERRVTKLG